LLDQCIGTHDNTKEGIQKQIEFLENHEVRLVSESKRDKSSIEWFFVLCLRAEIKFREDYLQLLQQKKISPVSMEAFKIPFSIDIIPFDFSIIDEQASIRFKDEQINEKILFFAKSKRYYEAWLCIDKDPQVGKKPIEDFGEHIAFLEGRYKKIIEKNKIPGMIRSDVFPHVQHSSDFRKYVVNDIAYSFNSRQGKIIKVLYDDKKQGGDGLEDYQIMKKIGDPITSRLKDGFRRNLPDKSKSNHEAWRTLILLKNRKNYLDL